MSISHHPSLETRHDCLIDLLVFLGLLCLSLLACCSCSSTKQATQLVEHSSTDTIYLSNLQYDSIYIYNDHFTDRSSDTLLIRCNTIEYRYRLLRDTIRLTHRDSIPYEVTVTEVKEITRPLSWFDHLTRACFWICTGSLFILLYRFIKYFRSGGHPNH